MKAKKLPSGSYRVQVVVGYDAIGKRVVKSFTADTEWEAIKQAQEYKDGHQEKKRKDLTVRDAIDEYINSRINLLEKATIRSYRQIQTYRFQSIMDMRIFDLQAIDIQKAINIDSKKVGAKYIKNAYGLLKTVLKMM